MTETKTIEASLVEEVLREVSEERRHAHADLKDARKAYDDLGDTINDEPENKALILALNKAQADVDGNKRFEKRLPKQVFDERKRSLDKEFEDTMAKVKAMRKLINERLLPFVERVQSASKKVEDLAREWDAHQRLAKAAGIDLKRFWAPDNQVVDGPKAEE